MSFFKREQPKPIQQQHKQEPFVRQTVMAKLKMGQPGDQFEKEADATADKVVSKTSGGAENVQAMQEEEKVQQQPIASGISSVQKKDLAGDEEPVQAKAEGEKEEPVQMKEEADVQRQEEGSESDRKESDLQAKEDEEPIQAKEDEEPVQMKEDEEPVQPKATAAPKPKSATSIESKLKSSKGGGQKLSGKAKSDMEAGFGADFSNVNIHTDGKAAEMSDQIGAQAFTHGNDVYFNQGKYDPASQQGKHLLAHELTHTIQQEGAAVQNQKGFTINMSPDPLQSDVAGLHFVSNPSDYSNTLIAKLPKGTEFKIIDKSAKASFNKGLSDKSLEWWKVQVVNSSSKSLKGQTGYVMKKYLHGVSGDTIYYKGENEGNIVENEINCLGHASETNSTVAIFGSVEKSLKGMGYNCMAVSNGKTAAEPHIKDGKDVMMVYLYMFKSAWRDDPKDQPLSFSQLAKKYGWNQDSWKADNNVLFDPSGKSLPTDYHALRYNPNTKKWEWVAHNKKKKSGGGYDLDSKSSDAAASNPDSYWGSPDQLLTKIICWK